MSHTTIFITATPSPNGGQIAIGADFDERDVPVVDALAAFMAGLCRSVGERQGIDPDDVLVAITTAVADLMANQGD